MELFVTQVLFALLFPGLLVLSIATMVLFTLPFPALITVRLETRYYSKWRTQVTIYLEKMLSVTLVLCHSSISMSHSLVDFPPGAQE